MKEILCNDKFIVVIAVLIIALVAMATFPEGSSENIVTAIASGLFGIAVGKSL
jgi:hypothetical protein